MHTGTGSDTQSQRLDKWLWFARLFKTRAEAAEVCASRHLRLDGRVIDKPHAAVRMGSVISFPKAGKVVVVKVEGIADHRGPFNIARHLYADLSPQPWRPAEVSSVPAMAVAAYPG